MTEEAPGNAPESTLPIKRRRGRPRKDESLSHGENSLGLPVSDGAKKNRHDKIDTTANDDNAFVGQMVSGILDGSFDAGYLLTVKVGNTDTVMRGLVFDPRLSVPISAENDVAPHVKMFKRSEIPLPIPARPLSQAPPIMGRKEVSYELPTNLHECNVTVLQPQESLRATQIETNQAFPQASQPSSSQLKDKTKTAATLSKGPPDSAEQAVRTAPQMAPTSRTGRRKSDHITKNGVILLPYYPVPSVAAQASPSEVKTQSKTEEPALADNITKIQANNMTTIQSGLPNGATADEDTKLKAETEPSVEIRLGSGPGKELPPLMEQLPAGVQSHGFTPAIPDATLTVGPSTRVDCTLPPGVQSHGFTPTIPDATLKGGPSTGLDCTLPPAVEPFQSVSQSLEMFLEKKVSPLGHLPLAGMQEVMQPNAKILEGGHFSASPSTGAVEVPIMPDLHFGFMSNHPMGAYEAVEHELLNPTPPSFAPKDTI
ncbi:hypothetical protein ACLOJK_029644 [Asimina triloba]